MASSSVNAVLRRLDDLSNAELLEVHREVCRRAAAIYEPLYREKRKANWRTGTAASPRGNG